MTESALSKKMKLKAGQYATIINAPENYMKELESLPANVKMSRKMEALSDWIQIFVKDKAESAFSVRPYKPGEPKQSFR
jgi:hypothetical protein